MFLDRNDAGIDKIVSYFEALWNLAEEKDLIDVIDALFWISSSANQDGK